MSYSSHPPLWYSCIDVDTLISRFDDDDVGDDVHPPIQLDLTLPADDGESLYSGRSTPDQQEDMGTKHSATHHHHHHSPIGLTAPPSLPPPLSITDSKNQLTAIMNNDDKLRRVSKPPSTLMQHDYQGNDILVRTGPNYKRNGKKLPSQESLYEFQCLEVIRSEHCKLFHVAETTQLPGIVSPELEQACRVRGLPTRLIINVQLPDKAPNMFGGGKVNDPGTSVVFYFMARTNLPPLEDPSVKLCRRFFAGKAPGRFKVIGFVDNLIDLGISSLVVSTVERFNGKPVIIHKTGAFFEDMVRNYAEIDIDVHAFPYVVTKPLATLRSTAHIAKLRAAFVIQGETDDELPERLLGCAQLQGLDLEAATTVI